MNDLAYPLDRFTAAQPITRTGVKNGERQRTVALGDFRLIDDLDELPDGVSARIRKVILEGLHADPEHYPSRSEAVYAVICAMARAGCPDEMIAGILLNPKFGVSESILEHGAQAEGKAAREIASARNNVDRSRSRIVWSEQELPRCLDESEAALMRYGIPIYAMGDRLVQVVRLDALPTECDQAHRTLGRLVVKDLGKHRLLEHMLASANFVKLSGDKEVEEKPTSPPLKFAEHYIARIGAWRVPVLAGIVTMPTMRPDGSIVAVDGYDSSSRLIVDTQGVEFPPVPEMPTYEEAQAALNVLADLLCEFPFISDDEKNSPDGAFASEARSVAIAMILTAVARPAFRAAPIFGISAPTMATGKSLLADVVAMIVTGRCATKMSQGANEEEDEKRLLSVLLGCDPIIVIDNVARPVSGDSLCTILTDETWRGRMLGRTEMREVPTKALFMATGNNLAFREDMASRAVLVSLDAEAENPGEREFRRDLREYVPEHRSVLATAALTVLRGYIAAGRPKIEDMRRSRFGDWDLVRAALMWLGEPDPWGTNTRVTAGDNTRSDHIAIMAAIKEVFGCGTWLSTTQIVERSHDEDEASKQLNGALSAVFPHGVSAQGLARYLSKFGGRRADGMWIKVIPNPKKGGRYAIMCENGGKPDSLARAQQFDVAPEDVAPWLPDLGDFVPDDAPY